MANEKRLIDANAIEKAMNDRYLALVAEYGYYDHYTNGYGDALFDVENAPTVDAVEVVRCEKCAFSHYLSGIKKYECHSPFYVEHNRHRGNHFCSYGERREA